MGTETHETGLLRYVYDDGGRSVAGFKGEAPGDCVVRAIAIATRRPYRDIYDDLHARARAFGTDRPSPRMGVQPDVYKRYLAELGWLWTPTMRVGAGCTVHLNGEVYDDAFGGLVYGPALIVRCSRHLVAVTNGEVRDTHDPSRDGTRCVYGYWKAAA